VTPPVTSVSISQLRSGGSAPSMPASTRICIALRRPGLDTFRTRSE